VIYPGLSIGLETKLTGYGTVIEVATTNVVRVNPDPSTDTEDVTPSFTASEDVGTRLPRGLICIYRTNA
jgi:hypothetical protein